MHDALKTHDELLAEVAALRARLAEPEETLLAIQSGQVDAFVVLEGAGEQVYTLATAELLRQLQVITDSLPVLVAYLDGERRYRFNSRLYESWFARSIHEITGRLLAEVLGEAAYAAVREHVEAALRGRPAEFESWLEFPGVGHRCVHVNLIPHVHHEQVQGFVAFVQDISERRRAEEALAASNRAKDHFLATLSHELRTPLTPVLATVSRLLAGEDLSPGVRAGLAMIRRNVELEARLIDDLLDLTRIGRGKLELHYEPTDLREILQQALETCDERELAARRLVQDLAAEAHLVWGDPSRLIQVFWNLLSNALKFTPQGGTIELRSRREAPAGGATAAASGQLVVEVSDSGVGVDPAALPHIFDAFDQGEADIARRFGGLGLGLAISRAIVELHGGRLTALSAGRDRGATFAVSLPLPAGAIAAESAAPAAHAGSAAPADPAAPAAPAEPADPADGHAASVPRPSGPAAPSGLRILVVEDHADTAETLTMLLQANGHRVTVVGTVAAALAAVEAGVPDLLISDLGLPDGDGDDLMRALARRHPGLRGIALSGYGMEADHARTRDAGFAIHLVKPVTIESLQAAVQRLTAPKAG